MNDRIDFLVRTGAAQPGVLSLGGGLPAPKLFPRSVLADCAARVMGKPEVGALQYGWPEGRKELRAWVADRLRQRGAEVDAEDVLITSGAQQALTIAAEIAFPHGARVSCDRETYPAALDLFRRRGFVPTVRRREVAGFYSMPAVGNPQGLPLSAAERAALMEDARAAQAWVIEDDAYAELRFDGHAPRPLLADHRDIVLHVGTMSKTLCPGLRIGWLIPPPALRKRALEVKHTSDLEANTLSQAILEDFLAHADYDDLLSRARRLYARRAEQLGDALRRTLPSFRFVEPQGGFTVWVETDHEGDDAELLKAAIRKGVSVDPGRSFRVSRRTSPIALRLSFSNESSPRLAEGVSRLAQAWEAFRRSQRRHAREAHVGREARA